MKEVRLGQIDLPSGMLMVLDPALAHHYRHDRDPQPKGSPARYDMTIVGPDAARVRQLQEHDCPHWYDVAIVARAEQRFAELTKEHGLEAHLEVLEQRIPHRQRAALALQTGSGAGLVPFNGMSAIAIGGLPTEHPLPLLGELFGEGDFRDRWHWVDVVVDESAEVARWQSVAAVTVEQGDLMCLDLELLAEVRAGESTDGLADSMMHGPDAAQLADEMGVPALKQGGFGWQDLAVDKLAGRLLPLQRHADLACLDVQWQYRPHCHCEWLRREIRSSELRVGTRTVSKRALCAFDGRWGEGRCVVKRGFDAQGELVRIRLDLGSNDRQRVAKGLVIDSQSAIVSRKITDEGQPPMIAERHEPLDERDSGWSLASGSETMSYARDAGNLAVMRIDALLAQFPAMREIIDAKAGERFQLVGDRYVHSGNS